MIIITKKTLKTKIRRKRQLSRIRRNIEKKERITKRSTGKKGNAARWSDDMIIGTLSNDAGDAKDNARKK